MSERLGRIKAAVRGAYEDHDQEEAAGIADFLWLIAEVEQVRREVEAMREQECSQCGERWWYIQAPKQEPGDEKTA